MHRYHSRTRIPAPPLMTSALTYSFPPYRLLPSQRQLLSGDVPVKLGGRAFDMLVALVERHDRVVSKNELMDLVWPGLVVEENNLQVQIVTLRKLLGHPSIATVPGRGYRFALPLVVDGSAGSPANPAVLVTSAGPGSANSFTAGVRRTNLPEHLPALVGRDDDLRDLRGLLQEHALVTVAGAGGIGKTRLAQHAAAAMIHDFAEGVWWVELAALSDAELVPAAVARILGVEPGGGRDATQSVAAALRSGAVLLVLDNAEHLLDGVAKFVEAVLETAPATRLLVTSQEVLRLADEHPLRLASLSLPVDDTLTSARASGAVSLFVARARAIDARFELKADNRAAVVDVCRRLDGIPLALELAAARLPLLGIEGLRARLDERFKVLTAGSRAVLRRHQTLRAALEWSHGLLSGPEQAVFRRLGVFTGGFTLECAQRVADDDAIDGWDVLEHLGTLVDKSLVVAEGGSTPRYRMLETTRLFALERLAEAGETQALLRRHAQAMATLLSVWNLETKRWRATAPDIAAMAAEFDNARVAVEWAANCDDHTLALDVGASVFYAFTAASAHAEYLEKALPLCAHLVPGVPQPVAAHFWASIAAAGVRSAHASSRDAAYRAAALYRDLGEDGRLYDALTFAVAIGARRGEVTSLQPLIDEAVRIERADWAPSRRSNLQWARHRWLHQQGRWEEALQCALAQAELCGMRSMGERQIALGANVADCEIALGRVGEAEARAREALAALEAAGETDNSVGHVMDTLMLTLVLQNRYDEALPLARRAQRILEREGDDLRLLEPLAVRAAGQGRLIAAARIAGHVDEAVSRSGEVRWPSVAARRRQLDALLHTGLAPEVVREHLRAGAALSRDEAFALAFGDA